MKKINNKLATVLLRGVVALSGLMATMTLVLFTESLISCAWVLLVGTIIVVLVDEYLKS